MTCCKIYVIISALIVCYVNANYDYDKRSRNFKSLSHLINAPQVLNSQHDIYESASSEILPMSYYNFESSQDGYRNRRFENPSQSFPRNIKKKLAEEKNLKKTKIPFLINNKNTAKYKELFSDSEIAHCREIKVKSSGKEDKIRKTITTCYKCEDPKTKSVYERCIYTHNSPPEESVSSSSTKMKKRFPSTLIVSPRYRRSNDREENDYGSKVDYGITRNPYRFTDEYFIDATYDVPAAVSAESQEEKCEKIVKNSMVCMICHNDKTNSKYEQCSYVKQPREKASAYVKSDSFEKPQKRKNIDNVDSTEHSESNPYSEFSDVEESNVSKKNWNPTIARKESREYPYPSEDQSDQRVHQDALSATACKQIQRDSKTCTVCKDPKIGGVYEKCTYNHQPSDKLYKYSRSKSFGYPDKISNSNSAHDINKTQNLEKSKRYDYPQSSESTHDYLDRSKLSTYPRKSEKINESQRVASNFDSTSRDSPPDYSSDYSNSKEPSDYQPYLATGKDDAEFYEDETISSSKPVSERYAENINAENCKKFQKDSMICTVCKDSKTGNDFEQCSYSYQPSDKIFSYSKSSSFGNSRENDKYRQMSNHEDEQSPDNSETAKDSYNARGESYEASTTDEAKDDFKNATTATEGEKQADVGYLNTAKKKAEIEEFMQNFRKKDRSKCRKTMRDKMTCYQCVDENGFQKEECVFVTGQEPDQLEFRETKEYQIDPVAHSRDQRSSSTKMRAPGALDHLEPSASASKTSYVKLEKPDNDYPEETQHMAEESKEAEPYDYTSETKSRYDKVLGLTLPAYMFATSEHEAAFDEIVASSHNRR